VCGHRMPLTRRKTAVIDDRVPGRNPLARKEIITRLLRNRCELCQRSGPVQVHHAAKLTDLAHPGPGQPAWTKLMVAKRRKSLVVCTPCHDQIHTERPPAAPPTA
jgi:AI2M/AI1M-like, HNH endonuclease